MIIDLTFVDWQMIWLAMFCATGLLAIRWLMKELRIT